MENTTIKKVVNFAVYEGMPLLAGLALAMTLVPIDGGSTLVKTSGLTIKGVAKFALVSLIGYGGMKAAIQPDQLAAYEEFILKQADAIYNKTKKTANDVSVRFAPAKEPERILRPRVEPAPDFEAAS